MIVLLHKIVWRALRQIENSLFIFASTWSIVSEIKDHAQLFTFLKQSFNVSLDFCNVRSLMNYTNLIDSCQAHLPVQYASNIKHIRQKWYWCCDWQRATPELHVQNNKPLVCSIGCPCSIWLFRFSISHSG